MKLDDYKAMTRDERLRHAASQLAAVAMTAEDVIDFDSRRLARSKSATYTQHKGAIGSSILYQMMTGRLRTTMAKRKVGPSKKKA